VQSDPTFPQGETLEMLELEENDAYTDDEEQESEDQLDSEDEQDSGTDDIMNIVFGEEEN
jgi:hypothetical protein